MGDRGAPRLEASSLHQERPQVPSVELERSFSFPAPLHPTRDAMSFSLSTTEAYDGGPFTVFPAPGSEGRGAGSWVPCCSLSQGTQVPSGVTGPSGEPLPLPNTPLQALHSPASLILNPDSRNAGCPAQLRGETGERLPHPRPSMAWQLRLPHDPFPKTSDSENPFRCSG